MQPVADRLNALDATLRSMEAKIDRLDTKIDSKFNLLVGMMALWWATIIAAILFHH